MHKRDLYPIKQILVAKLATMSSDITIKEIVGYLGSSVKTANYFRFRSHVFKTVFKKLGLSAFFIRGFPRDLLEQQGSAEELEQALDDSIETGHSEYFNLMNELFETVINGPISAGNANTTSNHQSTMKSSISILSSSSPSSSVKPEETRAFFTSLQQ